MINQQKVRLTPELLFLADPGGCPSGSDEVAFSLTPALSPEERVNRTPRFEAPGAFDWSKCRMPSSLSHELDSTADYTDHADKSASPSAKSAKSVVNKSVQVSNVRNVSESALPEGEGKGRVRNRERRLR